MMTSRLNILKKQFALEYITISYLVLPYFIFWIGWLKLHISLPIVGLTIYSLYKVAKYFQELGNEQAESNNFTEFLSIKTMIKIIVVAIMISTWVYFSGSGGFSLQNGDYEKHNAMLRDLSLLKWPASYYSTHFIERAYYLCYYFAYYLPAALIGHFFGIMFAVKALFIWTLVGCLLSFAWICKLTKSLSILVCLLFILFSGMDIIGFFSYPNPAFTLTSHIEWWSGYGFWQYSANSSLLWWVPQHAISGWLITSLLIQMFQQRERISSYPATFIYSLSSLWSPFVMIGLIPLWLLLLFNKGIKRFLSIENILTATIILTISGLLFSANLMEHRSGFILNFQTHSRFWPKYFIFLLLECCMFMLLFIPSLKEWSKKKKQLLLCSFIYLALAPFYILGYYNDFAMRSTIPALFILQLLIIYFLAKTSNSKINVAAKTILIICLIIGAATPFTEINRSVQAGCLTFGYQPIPKMSMQHVTKQYFANSRSFFFKYLSKPAHPENNIPFSILRQIDK